MYRPDQLESLESIWEQCPIEEPIWGPPTSILECPLPGPMEELPMVEDEMPAWFHYPFNPTDTTFGLNGQPSAESSHLQPSTLLLEKAPESYCQVLQSVLPGEDESSDSQLGTYQETTGAEDLGGLNSKGNAQSNYEAHNEVH
jgi:hypothetical protein